MSAAKPEMIRLENGVRVALDPMPGFQTVALGIWIAAGTRQEPQHINGVAHLFEHMAFKGAGERDARALAEAFEEVGASANAATGHERTCYTARLLREHAALGLELLLDMLQRPLWLPEELEREKLVVLQEIDEAADQPDDRVFQLHQSRLFAGCPLGWPILGTPESLARISVADLQAFQAQHFTASAVVVSIAGGFERAAVLELIHARLGGLAAGGPQPQLAPVQPVAARVFEHRPSAQAHLSLSWPAPASGARTQLSARVLAEILGGGMASRLFQEVRERLGLAYAVDAYLDGYSDVGRLGVYAGSRPQDAERIWDCALAALEDLSRHGPSAKELLRAKRIAAAHLLMGAESVAERAEARAAQVFLHDRLRDFGEIREEVEAVDAEEVQARAGEALQGPHAAALVASKAQTPLSLRRRLPG